MRRARRRSGGRSRARWTPRRRDLKTSKTTPCKVADGALSTRILKALVALRLPAKHCGPPIPGGELMEIIDAHLALDPGDASPHLFEDLFEAVLPGYHAAFSARLSRSFVRS